MSNINITGKAGKRLCVDCVNYGIGFIELLIVGVFTRVI